MKLVAGEGTTRANFWAVQRRGVWRRGSGVGWSRLEGPNQQQHRQHHHNHNHNHNKPQQQHKNDTQQQHTTTTQHRNGSVSGGLEGARPAHTQCRDPRTQGPTSPWKRGGRGESGSTNPFFYRQHSLNMTQRRHPAVAGQILQELSHPHVAGFHIAAAGAAREELVRTRFVAPSWTRLAEGLRPLDLSTDWHARPWVATGSNTPRALTPRGEPGPTTVKNDGAGIVAFLRRPSVGCLFFLFSYQRVGTVRLNTVPGLAPPSSLASSSSIFS